MIHCCSYNYNYSINKTKTKQIEKYKQIVNKSTNSKINVSILTKKKTLKTFFILFFFRWNFLIFPFFRTYVGINS